MDSFRTRYTKIDGILHSKCTWIIHTGHVDSWGKQQADSLHSLQMTRGYIGKYYTKHPWERFFLFIPIPGLLILFKYFKVCTKMFSYTNMPATCRCFYSTKLELLGLEALLFSTPLNFINLKRFIQCDSRLLTAKSGKNGLLHRWDHTCVLLKHCHRTAAGQSACPTGHRLCQTLFNLLNFTPFGP